MVLPPDFLLRPIAHRGLHDLANGVPENSPAAFRAAISHGYGIELDLQLSADGQAMVFHDETLDRLTEESGLVNARTADALATIQLKGGADRIPTLAEVLKLVDGAVPLLIEIKDQDGALGPKTGSLEKTTAETLKSYKGPVAVMSFNPHAMMAFHAAAPDIPAGLVTCDFTQDWPNLTEERAIELNGMPDLDRIGACFLSHDIADLTNSRVLEAKRAGLSILCWTVRSREAEETARKIADNITFEGYLA